MSVPREKIPWYPTIEQELCTNCGVCVEFGLPEPGAAGAVSAMAEGASHALFQSGLTAEKVMDLIPVRPLASCEEAIKGMYRKALEPLYAKLK
jgi:pyrroline-5-carboxylate reductase